MTSPPPAQAHPGVPGQGGAPVAGSGATAAPGATTGPLDGQARLRHFLRDDDLTPAEQAEVLDLASELKAAPFSRLPLEGPRTVAVLFDKPSLRTRVSFATGIAELGGYPLVLDQSGTHAGRGESVEDSARVLARQAVAIVWRTFGQDRVQAMAAASAVPVVNALTDQFHPCQVLADLQTVREAFGRLAGITLTFLGDGSGNMAHSYLLGGATAGLHVRICAPERYWPDPVLRQRAAEIAARTGGSVTIGSHPGDLCPGSDLLATDVWTSMGQEGQERERVSAMSGYALDETKLAQAGPGCRVLHCLPAHRGEEIAAEVIDGPASLVWDQAENRRHAQKALLCWLLDKAAV